MPRNSDLPDYKGIKVQHVNDWNAIDYHKPKSTKPKEDQPAGGFQPVQGMVSPRQRRVSTSQPSQDTIDQTSEAARKDWRNRGLSDNEIIDY